MLFQISVVRELRYALSSTLFALTPFVFSAVIFFIGLGSSAARQLSKSRTAVAAVLVALSLLLLERVRLGAACSSPMSTDGA